MTLTYDVQRVLADDGGWMTDREVCAVLDAGAESPVRGGAVHACLRNLADRGRIERRRPVDAPDAYRLLGEPTEGRPSDRRRHEQYVEAFPDGAFSALELAGAMRVSRQVATRHIRRAVEEGVLEEAPSSAGRMRYRRRAGEREVRGGEGLPRERVEVHPRARGRDRPVQGHNARVPGP